MITSKVLDMGFDVLQFFLCMNIFHVKANFLNPFFQELLYDPFPNIRSLSVLSVLKVMTEYWEVIPSETLKNLIVTIIQDLLVDANSSDVRQKVIKVTLEFVLVDTEVYIGWRF